MWLGSREQWGRLLEGCWAALSHRGKECSILLQGSIQKRFLGVVFTLGLPHSAFKRSVRCCSCDSVQAANSSHLVLWLYWYWKLQTCAFIMQNRQAELFCVCLMAEHSIHFGWWLASQLATSSAMLCDILTCGLSLDDGAIYNEASCKPQPKKAA